MHLGNGDKEFFVLQVVDFKIFSLNIPQCLFDNSLKYSDSVIDMDDIVSILDFEKEVNIRRKLFFETLFDKEFL